MYNTYHTRQDREDAVFSARAEDWRFGPIVYQVIVDRFAPSTDLAKKRHHYQAPKTLRSWNELPRSGKFLPESGVWSHEIDYWGGDLNSLADRLGHIAKLGANVLYLNPIHSAFTNHKYDATDYLQISPEYGTEADLLNLIDKTHNLGMHIMLDGVFNHVGVQNPIYLAAISDPQNQYREWFTFDNRYSRGVGLWYNAPNLPELRYENPAVKEYIYKDHNSVIRHYLRLGIDGWRLDTAFEFGYSVLSEMTEAAHHEQPNSVMIGEILNYPQDWFPAIDGIMNFTFRQILLQTLLGVIPPQQAAKMVQRSIDDAGIEPILRSWLVLENHDTPRLANLLPEPWQQQMARVLQFTLPGAPNLYYGAEAGMAGGEDPENRAPMRWDLITEDNPYWQRLQNLISLRKQHPALRIGEYRSLVSEKLLAFERYTNKVSETILVLCNPGDEDIEEMILVPDSRLMNATEFRPVYGSQHPIQIHSGLILANVPRHSINVLQPITQISDSYTPYKRMP